MPTQRVHRYHTWKMLLMLSCFFSCVYYDGKYFLLIQNLFVYTLLLKKCLITPLFFNTHHIDQCYFIWRRSNIWIFIHILTLRLVWYTSPFTQKYLKQAQRRAAAGRLWHKGYGVIYYQSIFPTQYPKWISIIPIVLVGKKDTKLIYHMPWLLVISIFTTPLS